MKRVLLSSVLICTLFFAFGQTRITFYTNFGQFDAQMYDSLKPITTGNFIQLADTGFYDGEEFYRVWDGFVIQGGNYWGSGTIIQDEFDSTGTISNVKHTISMANSGPNSGSSEFFINLKNNTFLDWDKSPASSAHPVFGLVHDGWNIVDSIAQTPVIDSNKRPVSPVIIDSIRATGSYLSIETIKSHQTVTAVYPNPVTNQTVLDIFSSKNQIAVVHIYDVSGNLILNTTIALRSGKSKVPLVDLLTDQLKTGVYFLTIQREGDEFTEKILVE